MLKVHSGHRYRPHRTVRLRLNTQVREKRDATVHSPFSNHTTENKLTLPVYHSAQHIVLKGHTNILLSDKDARNTNKTSFMDNYSFAAPCRQPPPFACLPSCLLLPPSTFRLPPSASRLPSAACRLPSASTHAPLLYAAPPLRTSPSIRAATNFPSRPRQTSLPGCDGQKNATRRSH